MVDTTTPEVAENSEPVETTVPDAAPDTENTPATDTRPPEEKGEDAETAHDEEPKAKATKAKSHRKASTKVSGKEWSYQPPTPSITTRIQRALGRHGFYYGPADGKFEDESIKGVQRAIKTVGYEGSANGQIGESQALLIQKFAKQEGNYTGPLNKKIDANTWAGFAVALERLK